MLTPWYIRFIFLWLLCVGLGFVYILCTQALSTEYLILCSISASMAIILGLAKMRIWYHTEIVAQRGATMLIQAKTASPTTIHNEIKHALYSKNFRESLKNGLNNSKWSIHNDTTLKNAQLRVEFNFPEEWLKQSSLWCALGIIAGALPENYSWGSSGRDKTKIVLTVITPEGTTSAAKNAAKEWVKVLNMAIHSNYNVDSIEESYSQAEVPVIKNKSSKLSQEDIILNPPKTEWNTYISLIKENCILKISYNPTDDIYTVVIANKENARENNYTNWAEILKLWARFPEVKTALANKFNDI